jgi:hypothetical protein
MSLADLKSLNPHITNFNHIKPNDFIVVRKGRQHTARPCGLMPKACRVSQHMFGEGVLILRHLYALIAVVGLSLYMANLELNYLEYPMNKLGGKTL